LRVLMKRVVKEKNNVNDTTSDLENVQKLRKGQLGYKRCR